MGIGRARGLLVGLLVVAPLVVWAPTPAVAGAPGGAGGGCGEIRYKRVNGQIITTGLCRAPGTAFHSEGRGTAGDPGCPVRLPKLNPDGTQMIDPDDPRAFVMEDGFGEWVYAEESDENVVPVGADPPPGANVVDWANSFPTFQDNAGGDRVFLVSCRAGSSSYYVGRVTVPTNDGFWIDLPGQLDALRAKVPLRSPSIVFHPGGPSIWGGFLINAPYAVGLGNDIWHTAHGEDLDTRQAWRLRVVASPTKATVVVKRGNHSERMACLLDDEGPITPTVPRFDSPTHPLHLPKCAFTARSTPATKISVSMEITYHVVGFIGNFVQFQDDEVVASDVETWSVVRAEVANTRPH